MSKYRVVLALLLLAVYAQTTCGQSPSSTQLPATPHVQNSECPPLPWEVAVDSLQRWPLLYKSVRQKDRELKKKALENYDKTLVNVLSARKAYVQFATKIAVEDQLVPLDIRERFQWTQCSADAQVKFIVMSRIVAEKRSPYGNNVTDPQHAGYSVVVLDADNEIAYVTDEQIDWPRMDTVWRGFQFSVASRWQGGEPHQTPLFKAIQETEIDVRSSLRKLANRQKDGR
jgi:hypothetical protein